MSQDEDPLQLYCDFGRYVQDYFEKTWRHAETGEDFHMVFRPHLKRVSGVLSSAMELLEHDMADPRTPVLSSFGLSGSGAVSTVTHAGKRNAMALKRKNESSVAGPKKKRRRRV